MTKPVPQELKAELEPPPWWVRAVWWVWAQVTWPRDAHRLKREGWKHTGFREWRSP